MKEIVRIWHFSPYKCPDKSISRDKEMQSFIWRVATNYVFSLTFLNQQCFDIYIRVYRVSFPNIDLELKNGK